MKSILERQKQESAKDYVLRVLIHNIVNTELVPGERLIDQEICGQLGVSRTPFREAELELAQKKLIDIRPKIGTYVSYIDSGLVEEIRHLRSVLEAELAVMACDLLSKDDIDMPPGLQSTLPRSRKQAQTQIRPVFLQPSQTHPPK